MGVTIWLKGASDSNPQIQIYPKLWNMFFLVFPKLFTFRINDCFLSHKKTVVFLKYLLRSNPRAIWSARVGQQVSRKQKEELDIQKCTAIKSYFLSFRMLELRAPSRPLGSAVSDSCLPSSGLSGPPPSYKIRTLLFLSTTMCQLSLASALFSSFNPGWNHSHDFQLTAGSVVQCWKIVQSLHRWQNTLRKHSVYCWGETSVLLNLNPEDTAPLDRSLGSWAGRKGGTYLFQNENCF